MTCNFLIKHNEVEMIPVFRLAPEHKGPLLVIVPSIFGIGPDVVEYAHTFAEAGALVYVLDSFWRENPGPLPIPSGAPNAMARMQAVDRRLVFTDLLRAIEAGQSDSLCNGSVIVLGICFGGQFAVKAAQHIKTEGLATWHGGHLLSVLEPTKLKGISLEMDFGESDPLISMNEVKQIKDRLIGLSTVHIRTHANSGHGFTHTGTIKCNVSAAQKAKDGVLRLINKAL